MATTGKSLLVVEDDEPAREALANLLRLEGYAVAEAGNGAEALDYLRTNPPPDLILLDMLLPVLDGWHFLTEVRHVSDVRHVPIIVITSTILTPDWARDHGCAGFLRKPIKPDELLAEVGRCVGA